MTEQLDYTGEFDPEFSYEKLSRETLLRLLRASTEYMLRIDGYWYLTVMDKFGNDEAFDCDLKVWEKAQRFETKTVSRLLNIRGNDVATVMKAIQASPWMRIYEYQIDLKDPNHAVVTYFTCPTLLALEKEGTGREKPICQILEPKMMKIIADYFNPDIQVIPLKVPPRTDYSDCCCQWEFKLEQ